MSISFPRKPTPGMGADNGLRCGVIRSIIQEFPDGDRSPSNQSALQTHSKGDGMRILPATIRGQVVMAFSVCFAFMALLIAMNYTSLYRLISSMEFFEISEELNSTILEMRRYEKNFFLFHSDYDIEENISYNHRLNLLLLRERENLVRSIGSHNYDRFLGYAGDYSTLMEGLRGLSGKNMDWLESQTKIRKSGQDLLVFSDQLVRNERRSIQRLLKQMASFPMLTLVSLMVLLLFVVFFIGERIVRPLARITRESEAIAQGVFLGMISPFGNPKNEIYRLIAALNRMMGELETRQEQLVQSRKIAAVGTLTSGIAHEINNPINNISLNVESLIESHETMDPVERLQLYQEILDQAERAGDTVKNLLEFSRANHPRLEEVRVDEVVDKTARLIQNELKIHKVRFSKEIRGPLPSLRLDKGGLQQVLVNLFLNSVQAMPNGGELKVSLEEVRQGIKIEVTDTGEGIPAENLDRIFDPFFTTKKEGEGTGLGLSVSYSIVKKHGGSMEVRSERGAGTTFSIHLPVGGSG
jgi:two-component system, NtrC family, sensor kinase